MARRTKPPSRYPSFPLYKDKDYLSLNDKQQAFVFGMFLKPLTGKLNYQIHQEVYGVKKKRSTSDVGASMLIHRNQRIKRCLSKLAKIQFDKLEVTSQQVLREERTIAFSDVAELFDENGYLIKKPQDLPERVRRAISSITEVMDKAGNIRYTIKLWSKGDSLKRIQKMKGMEAPEKHEITGPNGGPIQVTTTSEYDFDTLSDDELITFKQLLTKARK